MISLRREEFPVVLEKDYFQAESQASHKLMDTHLKYLNPFPF